MELRRRPQGHAAGQAGRLLSESGEIALPAAWADERPRLHWLVGDGSAVRRGQALCELEADKATAEIRSPSDGILRTLVPDGDVAVGAVLCRILPVEASTPAASAPAKGPTPTPRHDNRGVVPRSTRKAAEIDVLEQGRRGTLPSTVARQVAVGGLVDRLREEGVPLTAVVLFHVARALRRHPQFNASATDDGALAHEAVRIGVAMDVDPHGLIVPVVIDADAKTLAVLASELQVLLYRYLTKTLEPAALRGATFTITDLTSFGVAWSIPLLVDRQAAILGVGLIKGEAGDTLTLSMTFDHRVASGREAAQFLADVATGLADDGARAHLGGA